VGGPEMAPHTPRRSGRPGVAAAPLDYPRETNVGGPEMAPHTPRRSGRPGVAAAPLDYAIQT